MVNKLHDWNEEVFPGDDRALRVGGSTLPTRRM